MKYDEDLAQRMRAEMERIPDFAEKKMFGGIGFLINGNMACGLNGSNLIVRVGPEDYDQALGKPFARVFDMTGRPMKGWITVAPEGYAAEEDLKSWIRQGVAFAQSLPAK
jgi:TfoX/Sxy family transcriptional regulator of competence genes